MKTGIIDSNGDERVRGELNANNCMRMKFVREAGGSRETQCRYF